MLILDDIERSRHQSYRYFPVKKPVTLTFETDTRTSQITGYVESNDPDIFSDREGTKISIVCPQPFFESVEEKSSYVINGKGSVNYEGDVANGFVVDIQIGPNVMSELELLDYKTLTLKNETTGEYIMIHLDQYPSGSPLYGKASVYDVITISTLDGNKYISAYCTRYFASVSDFASWTIKMDFNILSAVDVTSTWFKLTPGVNELSCTMTKQLNKVYYGTSVMTAINPNKLIVTPESFDISEGVYLAVSFYHGNKVTDLSALRFYVNTPMAHGAYPYNGVSITGSVPEKLIWEVNKYIYFQFTNNKWKLLDSPPEEETTASPNYVKMSYKTLWEGV